MKLRYLANRLDPAMYMYIKFDDTQMTEIKQYVDDTCREALANVVGNIRIHA
jgi:phosphoribosylformylglycinamidine (FGAM) synthase PurS component